MGMSRRKPFSLREKPNRLSSANSSRSLMTTCQGGEATSGWRTVLHYTLRQRIVKKIMETLRRHLPFSGEDGLIELRRMAVRFEEKIYTVATSQSDYLRKISLKMISMESRPQYFPPNSVGNSSRHAGTA